MKEKYPIWLKAVGGILIFFSSIGINATVTEAAEEMKNSARYMMQIRSVSGDSIAEAFYQQMGAVYSHMADIISNAVGVVLIAGIAVSVMLLYPVIAYIIQKIKAPKANNANISESNNPGISCPHCGAYVKENDIFCASCGHDLKSLDRVQ